MKLNRIVSFIIAGMVALSVFLTGCGQEKQDSGVSAYESLGTLDGEDIDYNLAYFAAMYQQANYEDYYLESMGDDMWTETISGNETLEENVKNSLLKNLKEMLVLEKFASDYNVQLTTKESADIKTAAKQFMEDNTKKAIQQMGASQEVVERYLKLYTIANKISARIAAEVDTDYSLEQYKQSTFSYIMLDKKNHTKADAGNLLKSCSEDFNAAVEGSEYSVKSCTYGADGTSDTNVDENILSAVDTLSDGEIYGEVLETENAYFILRMEDTFDEEASANKRQTMISSAQEEHYNEVISSYLEKVTFEINEEAWNAITFTNHFSIVTNEGE